MSDSRKHPPEKLLLVAVLATLACLVWVMWSIYSVNNNDTGNRNNWMHEVVQVEGQIRHLDEVLTMSARMAAETGDTRWEQRFVKSEPLLNTAIEQAIKLAPRLDNTEGATAAQNANVILLDLERKVFELIRQGRPDQARAILSSPQYVKQKQLYANAMGMFHQALHNAIRMARENRARSYSAQITMMFAIVLILGFGWISVYRVLGRWRINVDQEVGLRQQLLETTQEGYWHIDPNGRTVDVNRAMCRILGRHYEEIIGKSVFDFVDDENRGILEAQIEGRKIGKLGSYEVQLMRPDGSTVSCLNNPTPLADSNGVFVGTAGMFSDISRLKDITLKFEKSAMEAEKANKEKSDLLANMSHELRTPLNAILGFSDTIRKEVFGPLGNEKYKEYLGDIYHSGEHLLELINDILDVSAIEADALELNENNANLSDIFKSSVNLIKTRADEGKVRVISFIDQEVPLVFVDERRLKQILVNLLSNAVKFTPQNGEVSLIASLNNEYSLCIAVRDTGIGMDENGIKTALSTFGQVDSGLNRKHEGSGLGLPLTKKLVELHGGSMSVESTKGHGTKVTVTLPKERVIDNINIWSKMALSTINE
ncbi:MAG: PAS domain-containing sensor histidine kinase [Rhodospirillales bacterium]|nr:PAS domain-containing sensor histidine kinase [Rhodospirillales bacterium]